MKLSQTLREEHVFLDVALPDKPAVLRFVADAFTKSGKATDVSSLLEALQSRELMVSTGIGNGIALPHAFSSDIIRQGMLLIRLARPIPFEAIDNRPVDIVLAMAAPETETSRHLQVLAQISRIFRDPEAVRAIRSAGTPGALLSAVQKAEDRVMPS